MLRIRKYRILIFISGLNPELFTRSGTWTFGTGTFIFKRYFHNIFSTNFTPGVSACSSSVSRQKKKENTVKLDPDYLERYRTIWIRKNGLESHACLCRKWWLKFSPSRRSRITTCATFAERSTRLVPHHFSLQIFWGPFTYIRVVLVNLSLSNLLVSVKKTYCYWNFINYFYLWPRFRLHKISMAPQASAVQNSSSLCSGASGADLFLGAGAVISYFGNGPVAE